MPQASEFLSSQQPRARWMRLDTAQLLKRFFFCERSLLVSEAAWIPAIAPHDIKIGLARFIWQSTEAAHAIRNRVFELRFPSRMLEEQGADRALIELFGAVKDSPSVPAFLFSIGKVLLPALRDSYSKYLEASDSIADGPTHRFLSLALSEKEEQISAFEQWAESALSLNPELRESALTWSQAVADRLSQVGGVGVGPSPAAPPPDLCRDRSLTSFRTGPPAIRAFGLAASIGQTWSTPTIPTEKGCSCNFVRPSAT